MENIIKNEKLSNLTKKIEERLSSSEYEVYALMISGLKYGEIALLLNKNPALKVDMPKSVEIVTFKTNDGYHFNLIDLVNYDEKVKKD